MAADPPNPRINAAADCWEAFIFSVTIFWYSAAEHVPRAIAWVR